MGGKRRSINQPYRGRGGRGRVRRTVVGVLVAALVCAVGFLFVLSRYIEYTDDGVRLVLPWMEQQTPKETPSGPAGGEVIVTQTPQESREPSPSEPVLPLEVRAVEVEPSAVTGGTAGAAVEAAGGNALVVTVKDAEGYLAWDSQSELARSAKLCGAEAFGQGVHTLAEEEQIYLIARVTCFQDLWMCVHARSMALTTSTGKLWYDTNGMPWLSAANTDARAYLTQLCLELADLGFDEIMLQAAAFPVRGRFSNIEAGEKYPADGLEAAAEAWLSELRAALEERGVLLSVEAAQQELDGTRGSALTAAVLANGAGRVWLPAGADVQACAAALEAAGMENVSARLALAAPGDDWDGSAILANHK